MQEISLEDTNKIRLSLSFKPLIDNAGSANDSGEIAEANYVRQRTAENKDRESKCVPISDFARYNTNANNIILVERLLSE